MKPILAAILILIVLSQTFSKWLVVMDYQINKDFIAKNLCENKAKPKVHCNGKCQMMKKLAEDEKENATTDNNTRHNKINIQEVVLSHETFMPSLEWPAAIFLSHNTKYHHGAGTTPLNAVFHPPAVV